MKYENSHLIVVQSLLVVECSHQLLGAINYCDWHQKRHIKTSPHYDISMHWLCNNYYYIV